MDRTQRLCSFMDGTTHLGSIMKLRVLPVFREWRQSFAKNIAKGLTPFQANQAAQEAVAKKFGLPWAEIIANLPALLAMIQSIIAMFKK